MNMKKCFEILIDNYVKTCFDERLEDTKKQFKKNNIAYELDNEKGIFNLYKGNKLVMQFWSYTGMCYIPSTCYIDVIGLKKCIKKYNKLFRR